MRNFQESWLSEFRPWLAKRKDHQENAFFPWCLVCDKFLHQNKRDALTAHAKTNFHITKLKSFLAKQNQQEQLAIYLNNPIQKQISSLEIRMALLLAEKHLSMNVGHEFIQILNKEIPNNPVLSKLTLGRTKATNIITKGNSVHTP